MGITSALTAEINCENNDFFTYGDLGTIIPKIFLLEIEIIKMK